MLQMEGELLLSFPVEGELDDMGDTGGELDDTGDTGALHAYSVTLSSVFVPNSQAGKDSGMQGPGHVRTWLNEDWVCEDPGPRIHLWLDSRLLWTL